MGWRYAAARCVARARRFPGRVISLASALAIYPVAFARWMLLIGMAIQDIKSQRAKIVGINAATDARRGKAVR